VARQYKLNGGAAVGRELRAEQIAIAPYIATIGKRFKLNGYRRATILDANTSALGYIFPWAGGVLVAVFLFSAWTGFGREYTTERVSKRGELL
jgi:hypothetical protein